MSAASHDRSLREWRPRASSVYAGVTRCEITPPVGMYARMWGAATHDRCSGVHQPLTATTLAFRGGKNELPLLLIVLDWVFVSGRELARLREPLLAMLGDDSARLIISCTHTHAAGMINLERSDLPGGEMIEPYLQQTIDRVKQISTLAIAQSQHQACTLTWDTGHCNLAANRDLPDPDGERLVCGFNPEKPADDTLLVGRLTGNADKKLLATIVNYACHPTTLAWENKLISPDYVGAMRSVVEAETGGAPCAFLQGASGELAPRLQYVADVNVAEGHGRQLGYAVLSVLSGMLLPGHKLVMQEVVESGAPLAVWRTQEDEPSATCHASTRVLDLPMKSIPTAKALRAQLDSCADRAQSERIRRRINQVEQIDREGDAIHTVWGWRLGDALLMAQPNEAYSDLQQRLREAFPDHSVLVLNVANGWCGYLYPDHMSDMDCYAAHQSPFTGKALDVLIQQCVVLGEILLRDSARA